MRITRVTLHFSELLLVLLKGKTSLVDALHILQREGMERNVKESAASLLLMMKKGKGFSESLSRIEKGKMFFKPLYLTLISAAELTGNVEAVLERIVVDMRRKEKARENVVNIMIYPSIIVLLAVIGTILIILKGIPFFVSGGLLSSSLVSDSMAGIGIAGLVLLLGGMALFVSYYKIFYLDSPEFRIFYLLDFLLRNNVSLSEALSHCVVSMSRTKYGAALLAIKKDIASGVTFSGAFAKIKHFSPYILGWLSVGDTYGNIVEVCGNVREYYERKDNKKREVAAKLIEPAIIVLTGTYLLIIMVTVILPLLTFTGGLI